MAEKFIDGENLVLGGKTYNKEELSRYNQVLVHVVYNKGGEAEMTAEAFFSSLKDDNGSPVFAQEQEYNEDGVTTGTKEPTNVVRKFTEGGTYRFFIDKSLREDILQLKFTPSGGTTPYGLIDVYLDIETQPIM